MGKGWTPFPLSWRAGQGKSPCRFEREFVKGKSVKGERHKSGAKKTCTENGRGERTHRRSAAKVQGGHRDGWGRSGGGASGRKGGKSMVGGHDKGRERKKGGSLGHLGHATRRGWGCNWDWQRKRGEKRDEIDGTHTIGRPDGAKEGKAGKGRSDPNNTQGSSGKKERGGSRNGEYSRYRSRKYCARTRGEEGQREVEPRREEHLSLKRKDKLPQHNEPRENAIWCFR